MCVCYAFYLRVSINGPHNWFRGMPRMLDNKIVNEKHFMRNVRGLITIVLWFIKIFLRFWALRHAKQLNYRVTFMEWNFTLCFEGFSEMPTTIHTFLVSWGCHWSEEDMHFKIISFSLNPSNFLICLIFSLWERNLLIFSNYIWNSHDETLEAFVLVRRDLFHFWKSLLSVC